MLHPPLAWADMVSKSNRATPTEKVDMWGVSWKCTQVHSVSLILQTEVTIIQPFLGTIRTSLISKWVSSGWPNIFSTKKLRSHCVINTNMVAPNENATITMPLIRAQLFSDGWQQGTHFWVLCPVYSTLCFVSHIHEHMWQNIHCSVLKGVKFNGISFSSVTEWADSWGRNYTWPSLMYYPSIGLKKQRTFPSPPDGQSTGWIWSRNTTTSLMMDHISMLDPNVCQCWDRHLTFTLHSQHTIFIILTKLCPCCLLERNCWSPAAPGLHILCHHGSSHSLCTSLQMATR
jgi:hypothetical protein